MKPRFQNVKVISSQDWDDFVQSVYKKPYQLQQQDGCRDRGLLEFSVPDEADEEDMHDSIPEVVNGSEKGVKLLSWLIRDPKQRLDQEDSGYEWVTEMWWHRNFYPDFQTLVNDLHAKGLLEAGEYAINIDW